MIKAKFGLFQMQIKHVFRHSIKLCQSAFANDQNNWGQTYQEHHLLFLISDDEMQRNPELDQNPGCGM